MPGRTAANMSASVRVMRERGLLGEGTDYATSMQGIMAVHPRQSRRAGKRMMNLNKSWIFSAN